MIFFSCFARIENMLRKDRKYVILFFAKFVKITSFGFDLMDRSMPFIDWWHGIQVPSIGDVTVCALEAGKESSWTRGQTNLQPSRYCKTVCMKNAIIIFFIVPSTGQNGLLTYLADEVETILCSIAIVAVAVEMYGVGYH
jgi:hypothetical protein